MKLIFREKLTQNENLKVSRTLLWRMVNVIDMKRRLFRSKLNGKDFFPHDTFDVEKLGYRYDSLPAHRPQALKAPPIVAHFKDVDIMAMEGKTYQVHIFVAKKMKLMT
eukprot:TRINITY_DN6874_c0_g1_i1.p1 TRINITY_DN6874_c0_g1~~TRINITY_DN6874_c0_g1_i1.p1  ORF type:complete len:108 (-),score=20.64 TRINITY_DN6874_c0_g1_i1:480-803(-)